MSEEIEILENWLETPSEHSEQVWQEVRKDMFEDLTEKMRGSWGRRWRYRWKWLKLEISEWWYKLTA